MANNVICLWANDCAQLLIKLVGLINVAKKDKQALGATVPPFIMHLHAIFSYSGALT